MPTTRRRRIVTRAVMAFVAVVLLVSGYIGSYLATAWGIQNGFADQAVATRNALHPLWQPIETYKAEEWPLSLEFETGELWLASNGRLALDDAQFHASEIRGLRRKYRSE